MFQYANLFSTCRYVIVISFASTICVYVYNKLNVLICVSRFVNVLTPNKLRND